MQSRIHLLWFGVAFLIGFGFSEMIWAWVREWLHTPPFRYSPITIWWAYRVLIPSVPAMAITLVLMQAYKRVSGGGQQTYYAPPPQGGWGPN